APFADAVDDDRAWRASGLTPVDRGRALAIWEARGALLALVEAMPLSWTHNDLHPGNLYTAGDSTVLIDWGFFGIGRVGEDAANLVFDAILDFFVAAADFDALA